jgi:putative peptide zinc metalloprotease protein
VEWLVSVAAGSPQLPPLREDLRLFESAPEKDGSPSWTIQDPVNNRFFRIGWFEFECLIRWPAAPQAIADDIQASTPLSVDVEQVEAFAQFLLQHRLLRLSSQAVESLMSKAHPNTRPAWWSWNWWLHHYLFFRWPLIRPEQLLRRLLPWMRPLGSSGALWLTGLIGLLGFGMVVRQWDTFTHSVGQLFTPAGLLGFALALIVAKTAHELGHALVATHYGVRVAHMGVAFVVLWPMLYTDTGESWKLQSHRQRLHVASAGIAVELALAVWATWAWGLLDDGPLRLAMLYLATTSWVLTLALNLSPFMRFDGYFILSDSLDFPNLHERAGAMARTALHRWLLGWNEPWPEPLQTRQRYSLILFAFVTWCYRFVVFLGIAIAVYFLFFKALGIFLFAIEIYWFILKPVQAEMKIWWSKRQAIPLMRRWLLLVMLLLMVMALAWPWAVDIKAHGMARPLRQQLVFSPFPAQIAVMTPNGAVKAGQQLIAFEHPDLQARTYRTETVVASLSARSRVVESDETAFDQRRPMDERLLEQQAEAKANAEEAAKLNIQAEFDGVWVDTPSEYRVGTWVDTRHALGVVVDPSHWIVDAYVEERELGRFQVGAVAHYRPHLAWTFMSGRVIAIEDTRTTHIPAALDAEHGGWVSTQGAIKPGAPKEALYKVRIALNQPPELLQQTIGHVLIEAQPHSWLWRMGLNAAAVIVRESGF